MVRIRSGGLQQSDPQPHSSGSTDPLATPLQDVPQDAWLCNQLTGLFSSRQGLCLAFVKGAPPSSDDILDLL
jgi:hypothetical protein